MRSFLTIAQEPAMGIIPAAPAECTLSAARAPVHLSRSANNCSSWRSRSSRAAQRTAGSISRASELCRSSVWRACSEGHHDVCVTVASRDRDHVIHLPHSLCHVSQLQTLLVRKRGARLRKCKHMGVVLVFSWILPIAPRTRPAMRPFVLLAFGVYVLLASAWKFLYKLPVSLPTDTSVAPPGVDIRQRGCSF